MKTAYFRVNEGDPAPLRAVVENRVRFEEVDPLGIVWHGRYPSYFDDARVALGDAYGMGYLDFLDHGVVTPIRQLRVDHFHPLSYPDVFRVEAVLHWSEAARIDYEFLVRDAADQVVATGCTVQLMLDQSREVMMIPPAFLVEIRRRWLEGSLEKLAAPRAGRTKLVERFTRLQNNLDPDE